MNNPFASPAPAEGVGFALAEDGTRWVYSGALTFENAAAVLKASRELALPKGGRVAFTGLAAADSSALAVLLALKRRATAERCKLHVEGLPETLTSLARVYGIDDLIAA